MIQYTFAATAKRNALVLIIMHIANHYLWPYLSYNSLHNVYKMFIVEKLKGFNTDKQKAIQYRVFVIDSPLISSLLIGRLRTYQKFKGVTFRPHKVNYLFLVQPSFKN